MQEKKWKELRTWKKDLEEDMMKLPDANLTTSFNKEEGKGELKAKP